MPAIEVNNLVKRYPGHTALHGVSFKVEKGEIVGYLGPNGSGKTTTIRVLSCFMPATFGSAYMGGFDVATQSVQVREILGYLPERVPLYEDMRVSEYLKFRAALKCIPWRERKKRIFEAVDACWLGDVYNKLIGQLSKGYRQRVGLADTILHRPDIMILDEPTVGLDPLQLKQIRSIIKDYGKDKAILFSTHILQEVEIMCDRVILINKGRIIAEGSPAELREKYRIRDVYHLVRPTQDQAMHDILRAIPGVHSLRKVEVPGLGPEHREHRIEVERGFDLPKEVHRIFRDKGWSFAELRRAYISLEDVFVGLIYHQFSEYEKEEFASSIDLSDMQTISQEELARIRRAAHEHMVDEESAAAALKAGADGEGA